MLKFRDYLKRIGWRAHCLRDLIDPSGRGVTEKLRSDSNVRDPGRVKSHQPRTGGIRRHRIIGQDKSVEWPRMSVQRSVFFATIASAITI